MRRGDFQGAAQLFLASIEIPESSKSNRQLVVVVGPDVWQLVWNVLEGTLAPTLEANPVSPERRTVHQFDFCVRQVIAHVVAPHDLHERPLGTNNVSDGE